MPDSGCALGKLCPMKHLVHEIFEEKPGAEVTKDQ